MDLVNLRQALREEKSQNERLTQENEQLKGAYKSLVQANLELQDRVSQMLPQPREQESTQMEMTRNLLNIKIT